MFSGKPGDVHYFIWKENGTMKYCPYCGAKMLREHMAFCMECGKKLPESELTVEEHLEGQQASQELTQVEQIRTDAKLSQEQVAEGRKVSQDQAKERKASQDQTEAHKPAQDQEKERERQGRQEKRPGDYDGYYDDILPSDEGQLGDGIDPELVKKVAVIVGSVLLIVVLCIVLMVFL